MESTSTAKTFSPSKSMCGVRSKEKGVYPPLYSPTIHAVDPDRGGGHDPFEIDEHVLAASLGGQFETAPIDRHEFVGLVVKAVPGQANIGVGNYDAIECGIVKLAAVGALRETSCCSASSD